LPAARTDVRAAGGCHRRVPPGRPGVHPHPSGAAAGRQPNRSPAVSTAWLPAVVTPVDPQGALAFTHTHRALPPASSESEADRVDGLAAGSHPGGASAA